MDKLVSHTIPDSKRQKSIETMRVWPLERYRINPIWNRYTEKPMLLYCTVQRSNVHYDINSVCFVSTNFPCIIKVVLKNTYKK